MNKAIFVGNLVRDPELWMMTNGKPRCTFTLAVSRPYNNAQGNRDADFIGCVCFEKRAEVAQKYLTKGRKVLVECHVKTGSYEKDDGKGGSQRVYTTEFVVDNIEFLSSKADAAQSNAQPVQEEAPAAEESGFTQVEDDDLPF